jgi:hypothetical protein
VLNTVARFEKASRIAEKAIFVSELVAAPEVATPVETQAMVESLQAKGFQVRPRFGHDGSLRFYIWRSRRGRARPRQA